MKIFKITVVVFLLLNIIYANRDIVHSDEKQQINYELKDLLYSKTDPCAEAAFKRSRKMFEDLYKDGINLNDDRYSEIYPVYKEEEIVYYKYRGTLERVLADFNSLKVNVSSVPNGIDKDKLELYIIEINAKMSVCDLYGAEKSIEKAEKLLNKR